jgi:fibronectin-binding autotransporter adhesin
LRNILSATAKFPQAPSGSSIQAGIIYAALMASTALIGFAPISALAVDIVIDGAEETVIGDGSGTLTSPQNFDALTVGEDLVGSVLGISGGGVMNAGDVFIGLNADSEGTVTISGAGSALTVDGDIGVGNGGGGALEVSGGGVVESGSGVTIGYYTGSEGTVTISGADSKLTVGDELYVARFGSGTLEVSDGGVVEAVLHVVIGNNLGSTGTVTISGAGSQLIANRDIIVTEDGNGTLAISDSGVAQAVDRVLIGGFTGSDGMVTISGVGSRLIAGGDVYVGIYDNGTLEINDGGVAQTAGEVHIGDGADSIGTLVIGAASGETAVGAGAVSKVDGSAADIVFGEGDGEIVFNHTETDYDFNANLTGDGLLTQEAGVTRLTGDFSGFLGAAEITGGTLAVNTVMGNAVSVANGGTLTGSGTVGNITVADGGTITPGTAAGTLTVHGNLVLSQNSQLDFAFGSPDASSAAAGVSGTVAVTGDLTLDGTLNLVQSDNAADGILGFGYYRLITFDGAVTDNALEIGSVPADAFTVTPGFELQIGANALDLFVGALGSDTLQTFRGGDGIWNDTETGWHNDGGAVDVGWAENVAVFNELGGGTVEVQGTQTFQGMQFVDGDFNLNGGGILNISDVVTGGVTNGEIRVLPGVEAIIENEIAGTGPLIKTQGGTLQLSGINTFAGGVAIDAGVLKVAQDANLGDGSGGLKFTGAGTLATTAEFDSTRAIMLEVDGAFDVADGTNLGLLGTISGAGGLIKRGTGTLQLAATNSYQGGLKVEAGELSGDAASIRGDIVNAGVVAFDQDDDASFAGNISGSGSLEKNGAGVLTLTGSSSASWSINAGALVADAGLFTGNAFVDGSTSFTFDQSLDAIYQGQLSGTGEFIKTGTAAVTLTGDNAAFVGNTEIANGLLTVNGTLGGTIELLSGGALGGSGTVGALTVASGSTIAAGNSIGTLTIAGDLVFEAGSVFEVEVNDQGDADLVVNGGTAKINGGTVNVLAENGVDNGSTFDASTTYTILRADGGVSGTFDALTEDFAFLDAALIYQDTEVKLKLNRNTNGFSDAAVTANQRAAATGAESLAVGELFNAVVVLNDAAARRAFDAVSGEIHASLITGLLSDSHFVRAGANDRMVGSEQPGQWGRVFGGRTEINSDGNAGAFAQNTGGLMLGADQMVDDWRLGVLLSYGQSTRETAERDSSATSKNYNIGIYGGREWDGLVVRGGLTYGWHDVKTERSVAIGGLSDQMSAQYGVSTLQAFGELAYRLDIELGNFEPFVSLANVGVISGGFAETGGVAALTGDVGASNVTYATLGLRDEHDITLGDVPGTVQAMVGWQHAFGNVAPNSSHALAGGDNFTVSGNPIDADVFLVTAGVDLDITDTATMGLAYSGQFGSGGAQQSVTANFRVAF